MLNEMQHKESKNLSAKERVMFILAMKYSFEYATACQIWKGYSDMGHKPYGWYIKPFGENAYYAGRSVNEVREYYDS